MSFITFAAVTIAIFCFLHRLAERQKKEAAKTLVEQARDIAAFRLAPFQDAGGVLWLKQRAVPNQRLVKAFNIENSFTTTDDDWHKTFLARAGLTIQAIRGEAWVQLFGFAEKSLLRARVHRPGKSQIPLAKLVRIVTFMTILNVLFGVDLADTAIEDVVTATDLINKLWIQSKDCSEEPISTDDQQRLQKVLASMLPGTGVHPEPRDNPLNLIIPAYETMWRVVLLTFVSSAFRVTDQDTIGQFSRVVKTVPECLGHGEESTDLRRALAFAKEGLRLYPPTKRIYRGPEDPPLKADIEKCHRDQAIWGRDTLRFKPSRFIWGLTEIQERAYIPFSIRPHGCPAERGFGVRTIILLVVVLARHFGTGAEGSHIRFNDKKLDKDQRAVLPNNRGSADGWIIDDQGSNM